jgi:hypothetical protein
VTADRSRRLHFVGSLPQFAGPGEALEWQVTRLAGRLRRLSGGETGERLLWFVPVVRALKRLPEIKILRAGEWTGYADTDRLKVRRGARLTVADIPLGLARYAREELDLIAEKPGGGGELPLQVGVPGYLDMALFVFGPLGVFRLWRVFLNALAAQVAEIHETAGDRAVFQLEVPAALVAVAATPPPLRPVMAELMAVLVTRQARQAPGDSRFGVHLCLGDLGHKAVRQLRDAGPVVVLANALVRRWPAGRRLEFVHLPMSGGDQPPSTDPDFYRPLLRLRIGEEVRIVAGVAHEEQDLAAQRKVRDLVERAVGGPVDIATSCGLGRRSAEQAERAVARMLALLPD